MTCMCPLLLSGFHVKKSAWVICSHSGTISIKTLSQLSFLKALRKLPFPALGSTITSCFFMLMCFVKVETHNSATSGLV